MLSDEKVCNIPDIGLKHGGTKTGDTLNSVFSFFLSNSLSPGFFSCLSETSHNATAPSDVLRLIFVLALPHCYNRNCSFLPWSFVVVSI